MKTIRCFAGVLALFGAVIVTGATEARADSCSASASTLISRSAGGTCPAALGDSQEFTLSYRITNASIIDDALSANDGDPVEATIPMGSVIDATLAQETSGVGGTALPTVLTFIPVCPVGDANAGTVCANNGDCASLPCGCQESLPGVTCTADGVNGVELGFGQDTVFNPSQQRTVAVIRVETTDTVDPPATCGEFFTRIDSDGDVIETTDGACDSAVTAGAQASADLHAPECVSDSDCGDTDCNVCADIDTDNHCEAANIGSSCGTDSDPNDCQTPACVDNAGVGECQQSQNDLPEESVCTSNNGVGVDAVECQTPLCDDSGTCANTADSTQNGNACGSDGNATDCSTPACLDGTCAQMQTPVPEDTACDNNNGSPVGAVDCQTPVCDDSGVCANVADDTQDGDPCGSDSNATDCVTPACEAGTCNPAATPVSQGTACDNNSDVPVDPAECQTPICDDSGVCANAADDSQNGDPCGSDSNATDCVTPACDAGTCNPTATPVSQGTACDNNGDVPVGAVECQTPLCDDSGVCANVADDTQDGNACGVDGDDGDCQTPACVSGTCEQNQINVPAGTACSGDAIDCTDDECDASGMCQSTPDDAFCEDADECTEEFCSPESGCIYDFICMGNDICRSPGYWQTHSGTEKDSVNVGQMVIDAVGPIEVCGQVITSTSGNGLNSSLEGLCMRVKGVKQRQLYRQLVAAAFNCGISGGDCDTITGQYIDVSFDDCSDVCAGDDFEGAPSVQACIKQLDCFNNGGEIDGGSCNFDGENSCHDQIICNEEIGVCPKSGPASSPRACKAARHNDCTIDSCDD